MQLGCRAGGAGALAPPHPRARGAAVTRRRRPLTPPHQSTTRPACTRCDVRVPRAWDQLSPEEKEHWRWRGHDLYCLACVERLLEGAEQLRLTKRQATLQRVKEELYPTHSLPRRPLHSIPSDWPWQGTRSFAQPWRPDSFVLERVERAHQRKADELSPPPPAPPAWLYLPPFTSAEPPPPPPWYPPQQQ